MPPFRTLLVVDAEEFSRNRDSELPRMHTEIRNILARACERSNLGGAWKNARFRQSTGDGILAVLPPDTTAALFHPFPDHLQDALATVAPRLRTRGVRLRLRVALHTGLVDDERPVTAGISTATTDVNRLLDCAPLRLALRDSDPDVTFTALIASAEAFEMFVRGGHTAVPPSRFTRVRAKVKRYDRPAYLYVPTPSVREHPDDEAPPDPDSGAPRPRPAGGMSAGNVTVTHPWWLRLLRILSVWVQNLVATPR